MLEKVIRVQEKLNKYFPGTANIHRETVKITVKELNKLSLMFLYNLTNDEKTDILIKRSGTGLTVIIKC